jgi:tRNA(His) 5'-end guanylyltransferase
MKFDDLDQKMRVFETAHDHCALPGLFLVARIDGRSFTRLTKEKRRFAAPFDVLFRDLMIETTAHLMECGFRVVYGYTQSDEISLLFHPDEELFHRKLRKFNSVLAGEASARFSLSLGEVAAFDCRLAQLPGASLVCDYFRWRQEDAGRNALNAHCYWKLRQAGQTDTQATAALHGLSVSAKHDLLFNRGINFNDLPSWQKRGVGLYWESYEKAGFNPIAGETTFTTRRRIRKELELPMKDEYARFVAAQLESP